MSPGSSLFTSAATRRSLQDETDAFVGRARVMVRRARILVTNDRSGCAGLLAMRRAALCRHLQRYQQFKHGCIFDPVVRYGTSSSQIVARTLKIECMEMGDLFGAFHARCLRMDEAEWGHYRQDMVVTVDRLLDHLDVEIMAIRKLLMISEFYRGSLRSVGDVG